MSAASPCFFTESVKGAVSRVLGVKVCIGFQSLKRRDWGNEEIADSQGTDGTFAFQLPHLMAGQFFDLRGQGNCDSHESWRMSHANRRASAFKE